MMKNTYINQKMNQMSLIFFIKRRKKVLARILNHWKIKVCQLYFNFSILRAQKKYSMSSKGVTFIFKGRDLQFLLTLYTFFCKKLSGQIFYISYCFQDVQKKKKILSLIIFAVGTIEILFQMNVNTLPYRYFYLFA